MAGARSREKKEKKERKSQDPYISPPPGGATAYPTRANRGGFVAPSDVITHANREMNRLRNVGVAEGQNFAF